VNALSPVDAYLVLKPPNFLGEGWTNLT
jgi:hypothetical protein